MLEKHWIIPPFTLNKNQNSSQPLPTGPRRTPKIGNSMDDTTEPNEVGSPACSSWTQSWSGVAFGPALDPWPPQALHGHPGSMGCLRGHPRGLGLARTWGWPSGQPFCSGQLRLRLRQPAHWWRLRLWW
jgi:hypothetical protein